MELIAKIGRTEDESTSNNHVTEPMRKFVQKQVKSGTSTNLSAVVRAGIRLLTNRDGARQFHALKADLKLAAIEAEAGAFAPFDAHAFEPDAFHE